MSRNTIIVLSVIGGVLALCCLLVIIAAVMLPRFVDQAIVEDSEEAANVGQSIATYDLPPGFHEESAITILGINMVMAPAENEEDGVIMFMSSSQSFEGNEALMQQQMEQLFQTQSGQQNIQLAFEWSEDITINGETTTLNVYEGVDDQGVSVRQASAFFPTESGGSGMVMIFAPIDTWDDQGFDDFLNSME
jgi:hypothetical protein